jgi:EmrB/QacA subfamily drug resistance transporter
MTVRRPPVVAAIVLSMFMSAMEATVVATAMPTVVADLHGIELYGWVTSIYMLASTVTIPLWGKLADLRGRRPVMLAGLVFFLVGSVLSGAAGGMVALIAFRAVQGVGAGALQPVALTIIGDLFTIEERGRMQGIFGAVWGLAAISGPLLGGLIVHALGWRWVFYVNVPFGLLSAAMLVTFYRDPERAAAPGRLDVAGALILSLTVLALLAGVGGRSPAVTLPLAALGLAAFLAVERRAPEPMIPLSLFRDRVIAVASVAGALMGAVMMASLTYLPLHVQSVLRGSPTEAGTAVAPMLIGWPVASAVAGRLLARVSYRALVRVGLAALGAATFALWRLLAGGAGTGAMRVVMLVFGAGMGLANTAMIVVVQERAGFAMRGVATASTMFFRTIGGAVAVGALGALLARRVAGDVPESLLRQMLGPEHGAGVDPAVLHAAGAHLAGAMVVVFGAIAALGALAALTGPFFPAAPRRSTDVPAAAAAE